MSVFHVSRVCRSTAKYSRIWARHRFSQYAIILSSAIHFLSCICNVLAGIYYLHSQHTAFNRPGHFHFLLLGPSRQTPRTRSHVYLLYIDPNRQSARNSMLAFSSRDSALPNRIECVHTLTKRRRAHRNCTASVCNIAHAQLQR